VATGYDAVREAIGLPREMDRQHHAAAAIAAALFRGGGLRWRTRQPGSTIVASRANAM